MLNCILPRHSYEFSVKEFDRALDVFAGRERRFGKTSEQIHQEKIEN